MKHWQEREEVRLEMERGQIVSESQHVAEVVNQSLIKLENSVGYCMMKVLIEDYCQEAYISFHLQPGPVRDCGDWNPTHHL